MAGGFTRAEMSWLEWSDKGWQVRPDCPEPLRTRLRHKIAFFAYRDEVRMSLNKEPLVNYPKSERKAEIESGKYDVKKEGTADKKGKDEWSFPLTRQDKKALVAYRKALYEELGINHPPTDDYILTSEQKNKEEPKRVHSLNRVPLWKENAKIIKREKKEFSSDYFVQLRERTNLSRVAFAEKYCIPYDKVSTWEKRGLWRFEYIPILLTRAVEEDTDTSFPKTPLVLGFDIRRILDTSHLNVKEFAVRYHISEAALDNWLKGKSEPQPYVLTLLERFAKEDVREPWKSYIASRNEPAGYIDRDTSRRHK